MVELGAQTSELIMWTPPANLNIPDVAFRYRPALKVGVGCIVWYTSKGHVYYLSVPSGPIASGLLAGISTLLLRCQAPHINKKSCAFFQK